ncbi:MAG: riboflavin kinase, partial [Halieaceae bacterium]
DGVPGVANVGTRPTVNDSLQANLEVHILDVDGDFYGQRLTVEFLCKLREEKKYESLEALKAGIAADIKQARAWLSEHEIH